MKHHFFFAYAGNKRQEVEQIYKNINFKNINTIVEPFCGTCALSYYIWTQNRTKNYKYILNDLDSNLIQILKLGKEQNLKELEDELNKIREEILTYEDDLEKAKKIYLEYIKQKNINAYVLANKCFSMRVGMFPTKDFKRYFNDKKIDLSTALINEFLTTADIEIYNENASVIIDKYDNKNSFIFLDPPYIESCNNFYTADTKENIANIYEWLLLKSLKKFKCKILICHENNWLFRLLFKDYLEGSDVYDKRYNTSPFLSSKSTKTTHICVKNYSL